VQQNQVAATAVEPVGRQVDLLGRGEMDELAVAGGTSADFAALACPGPLVEPTKVHQFIGTEGHGRSP